MSWTLSEFQLRSSEKIPQLRKKTEYQLRLGGKPNRPMYKSRNSIPRKQGSHPKLQERDGFFKGKKNALKNVGNSKQKED